MFDPASSQVFSINIFRNYLEMSMHNAHNHEHVFQNKKPKQLSF